MGELAELTVNKPKKKTRQVFDIGVNSGRTFMPPFSKMCKKCGNTVIVYANRPKTKCECGGALIRNTGAISVGLKPHEELHSDGTRTQPAKAPQTTKSTKTSKSN